MSSKFQECPFCGRDELHYTEEENLWGCYRCEGKWTGPWDADYWKSRVKKVEGERDKLKARVAELEAKCKTWEKRALRYANDAYSDDEVEAIKLMWEFQDNVT